MLDLGTVRPGTTLYIPFQTFDSNDPSASVTLTGLATTDIEIYKNGGTTQRASDNGYSLLDTDGIDFDGITGVHGFSVNLADNSTAGFYSAGAQYWVVVSSITVDAGTINFVAATFRIGYPDALLNTTIATLATQVSFTLTAGSANDDAYNGCVAYVHDVASGVQVAIGYVSDYTGSTKTVTLAADPGIFTMAATDNIALFPPSNVARIGASVITATSIATDAITATKIAADAITATKIASNAITSAKIAASAIGASQIATDAITAAKIAADAIGASELAADAVAEIADAVWDELQSGHVTAGSFGEIATEIASILGDTGELQTDWTDGGRLDLILDNILTDTGTTLQAELDGIQADTEDLQTQIGTAGAGLTAVPWNAAWDAEVESEVNDALDTAISELGVGAPTATPTIRTGLMLLYMALRNKTVVQTSGTDALEIYNDAGTKIASKLLTDDGSDYTEAEMS